MTGKHDASFAVQVISGLVSDVDTANAVLNHVSVGLFRHINDSGIGSLLDSASLENQLGILQNCLRVLTRDKGYQVLESRDRFSNSNTGQSNGISEICTNLLDLFCLPILNHVVVSGVPSDYSERRLADVLSLVVSCFSLATCDARTKVFRVLISLFTYRETSSFQLTVVKAMSQLYECHGDGAFDLSATDDLLSAVEELCLTADESFVGQTLVQLVPSILLHCDRREAVIARLWSIVERCYVNANDNHVSRCCFLICGLTDVFFAPVTASALISVNLLRSSLLWNCVQKGLQHREALTRKRTIFILRRALDFAGTSESSGELSAVGDSVDALNSGKCLSQLSSVWCEIINLFETLEEKQVSFHMLPRL